MSFLTPPCGGREGQGNNSLTETLCTNEGRATLGRPFLAVSFCALMTLPAGAQETTPGAVEVPPLVIESTRLNQTATEVGSSVTIITAEEIEEQGFDFVLDAVASAPGVTINQNGSFGGQASVRIRGAASEQTLVLVDGVPVNDPSTPGGGFNFARLDVEAVERIEILKGPQSTFWGTDAIGGVVSIITKRPQAGGEATAFAEYGSYDTVRAGASVGGSSEIGGLRVGITRVDTDGISRADEDNGNDEEDAFDSTTLSVRGDLELPGNATLDGSLLWTDASADFDSFNSGAQGAVADGDQIADTEELSGSVRLNLPLFEGRLSNDLIVGYSEIDRENFTNGATSFQAQGERQIYRYQGTLEINPSNLIAFGVEREETRTDDTDGSINSLFSLYELKPIQSLTLTAGLRHDDQEDFQSETTARLALAYNPTDQITFRASWGEGFKAPSLFQTTAFFAPATAPNTDLRPETSEGVDFGVDWRALSGKTTLGLTFFSQDTEDLIIFDGGRYENVDEVESLGVEVSLFHQLTDWMNVSADYAYIEATDDEGLRLVRVPRHSGDLQFSVDPSGPFSGSALIRYNGEERDRRGDVDDWIRVDLSSRYDLNDQVQFFGRVENLFDADYQQILGYGTPDRSGFIGVRIRY